MLAPSLSQSWQFQWLFSIPILFFPMNEHALGYLIHGDKSSLSDFQASSCLDPQLITFTDQYTNVVHNCYVPCGHCYQCMNSKGNDLFTRVYLDGLILGHAYYITLNFRSYDKKSSIPAPLRGMYWHKDTNNYWHKDTYSPQLLDKSVFRSFIRSLQHKYKKETIEYLLCSEYGSQYHRPHAHCIILSSVPISCTDFASLWPYGRMLPSFVDVNGKYICREYDDLFSSGAFDFVGNNSTKHSVKYVTKYATKGSESLLNPKSCKLAYLDIIKEYLLLHSDIPYNDSFQLTKYQLELIKTYERSVTQQNLFSSSQYLAALDASLISLFKPSVSFSRSPALGSLYANSHMSELLGDGIKLPTPKVAAPSINSIISDTHSDTNTGISLLLPRSYHYIRKKNHYPLVILERSATDASSCSLPSFREFVSLRTFFDKVSSYSVRYASSYSSDEDFKKHCLSSYLGYLNRFTRLLFGIPIYSSAGTKYVAASLYDRINKFHYIPVFVDRSLSFAVYKDSKFIEYVDFLSVLHALYLQLDSNYQEYVENIANMDIVSECIRTALSKNPDWYKDNVTSIYASWEELKRNKHNETLTKNKTDDV